MSDIWVVKKRTVPWNPEEAVSYWSTEELAKEWLATVYNKWFPNWGPQERRWVEQWIIDGASWEVEARPMIGDWIDNPDDPDPLDGRVDFTRSPIVKTDEWGKVLE